MMSLHGCARYRWAAAAAFLLLPGVTAWAQAGAAAPVAKIGVVNVRQAIVTTAEGKQASAQLQSQFAPKQGALDTLQKQISDLQNRLNNGARTLSDDEKARLQRQGDLLSHQYQRNQDDLQEAVTAAQSDIVDSIGRKMLDVLDKYARENGYAVVLDSSAQGSPVIYASNEMDITDTVVRLYDQAYPVKEGGATSSNSETKRPAGQATAPATQPGAAAAPKKTTP
jgi:outer membrane protein